MKSKKYFFILLVLAFSSMKCKHDSTIKKTPPLLANKMYALIDGVQWQTKGAITNPIIDAYYYPFNNFQFQGIDYYFNLQPDSMVIINMQINHMDDTGIYQLGGQSNNFALLTGPDRLNGDLKIRYADSLRSGSIHITKFDTQSNHVSGTFQFDVYDSTTNKIKHITNGIINNVYFIH